MRRTWSGVSQILFAAMMIVLGGAGFYLNDFPPVLQPVEENIPARQVLIYLSAIVPLITGLGLFLQRSAAIAARTLFVFLTIWLIAMKLPAILLAPASQESWSGSGETLVVVASAWVIHIWCAAERETQYFRTSRSRSTLRFVQVLFGLALIPFGIAHFIYLTETVELVPSWLPFPLAWAIGTGCAFVLAGAAIVIDRHAPLAARLATLQISGFSMLVWVPIIASGPHSRFQCSETIVSFALSASALVVATSYKETSRNSSTSF